MSDWPKVIEGDYGIRPAGSLDHCFYCAQIIGAEHLRDCAVIVKRVRIRYIVELEIDVPQGHSASLIEFSRNDSGWCADNALDELADLAGEGHCLCEHLRCEFVAFVDDEPRRASIHGRGRCRTVS